MTKPDAIPIAHTLRRWAIEKALPLWSTKGFDTKRGGFQERLNPDGSPDLNACRVAYACRRGKSMCMPMPRRLAGLSMVGVS